MSPERWEQITEIYHSAIELEAAARDAFLGKACAGDDSLRREVESLLRAERDAGDFIARPAFHETVSRLAEKPDAPLGFAQNLGHYQIIMRLGAGGMGEVYLARDSRLNRPVAVKILPASFADDPSSLRRFQTEAEAAATLNHPNVATIYSVEKLDGQSFITMEYVAGKTLDSLIPAGGYDLKIFLELFIPLSDALSHAHEKGVIHRDIKPGNLIVTPAGVPKILDFGLAQIDRPRADENETTLKITQPGQVFGTPSYMSPEQAEGAAVDHRSDIFSFGVVMYEALTGTRPFTGDSYASLISNLLRTEPVSVSELKADTPFLLARLIGRCLSKPRRERFQSMSEIRAILEETKAAVEAGISMESGAKPVLPERKPFARARFFAPLALLVALALAAVYYFRPARPPEPPINFANMTLRKLSQTGNVILAQTTPDGKSFVYNTIEENDARGLWIRRIEEKNALRLLPPQPVSFWGGLTVAHDGSQIFYIIADKDARQGTLFRVSSLGGAPRRLVEKVNDLGSLSPDGERILLVRYGERSQLISAKSSDGSDERVIATSETNQLFRDPQFSPDGQSIFSIKFERINGEEFWSLVALPAAGGAAERVIIKPRKERIGEIVALRDGSGLLINGTDAVSNLAQLYHVSPADGRLRRITNDLHSYFAISASADGQTVIAAQRNFARDIYVTEGADVKKLTTESNIHTSAVFTPDGRIVYDAADNNRPHIWIMNADGSRPQQLTPNDSADFEPRVSLDGRFIFFTSERTGERKIWRMNVDGSNPQPLTPVGGTTTSPVVLPDGQNILFTWGKENKTVTGKIPITGGAITELPLFSEGLLAVSPDGKQVAYVFFDESVNGYKVGVRALEDPQPGVVFNFSPYNVLLWAADGKSLLYRDIEPSRDSVSTIWQQPLAGGEPKPYLTAAPDSIFAFAQSADGKKTLVVRGKLSSDAVMLIRIATDER
jgi:eukaryotic-like serine/threonine-protein kinase